MRDSISLILVRTKVRQLQNIVLIIRKAQGILSSNLQTPLKGLAIGNGWIDGESQYPGYLEFAEKHDLIKKGSDVSIKNFCEWFFETMSSIIKKWNGQQNGVYN